MFKSDGWLAGIAALVSVTASTFAHADDSLPEKLKNLYFSRLSAWVTSGGNIDAVQSDVVTNCGKLIGVDDPRLASSAVVNKADRASFDMYVDVCVKLTIHRKYPQPEFSNPKTVEIVCRSMAESHEVFDKLCILSNLK